MPEGVPQRLRQLRRQEDRRAPAEADRVQGQRGRARGRRVKGECQERFDAIPVS